MPLLAPVIRIRFPAENGWRKTIHQVFLTEAPFNDVFDFRVHFRSAMVMITIATPAPNGHKLVFPRISRFMASQQRELEFVCASCSISTDCSSTCLFDFSFSFHFVSLLPPVIDALCVLKHATVGFPISLSARSRYQTLQRVQSVQ